MDTKGAGHRPAPTVCRTLEGIRHRSSRRKFNKKGRKKFQEEVENFLRPASGKPPHVTRKRLLR
jgi:hypothetical protein